MPFLDRTPPRRPRNTAGRIRRSFFPLQSRSRVELKKASPFRIPTEIELFVQGERFSRGRRFRQPDRDAGGAVSPAGGLAHDEVMLDERRKAGGCSAHGMCLWERLDQLETKP